MLLQRPLLRLQLSHFEVLLRFVFFMLLHSLFQVCQLLLLLTYLTLQLIRGSCMCLYFLFFVLELHFVLQVGLHLLKYLCFILLQLLLQALHASQL